MPKINNFNKRDYVGLKGVGQNVYLVFLHYFMEKSK